MKLYPAKISKKFLNPVNAGDLASANAVGTNGSFVCGAALQISLEIKNEKIQAASFKAAGCGFLFAAADVLCDFIKGEAIENAFDKMQGIEDYLGEFPLARKHCLELCTEALRAAIKNRRADKSADWNGDEALICTCFGVSEQVIEQVIAEHALTTVQQVTEKCGAGGGCGSCQPLITEILDDFWRADF